MNKNKTNIIEIIFNIAYLVAIFSVGFYLLIFSVGYKRIWGIMSLTLAIGDSFHLLPRIALAFSSNNVKVLKLAGYGKMVTSITMTIFYGILWYIGVIIYSFDSLACLILILALMLVRIILCLMPQNNWTKISPYNWTIYRNIPFFLQGLMVMFLYLFNANKVLQFRFVWLAVLLSFLFYSPVIIWGHKNSKLGMLMIPKSLAYVWLVFMALI